MRGLALAIVSFAVVGCASQPSDPQVKPAAAPPAAVGSSATPQPAGSPEAQRLTTARNLNLKVVDKDGQQLFCRSSQMTATRIARDMTCYTADQLDLMQAQLDRDLQQFNAHPPQSQGFPPMH